MKRGRPGKRSGGGARGHGHSWLKPIKARPPQPFFDAGKSALADCPETALLCAVLEDAFACLVDAQHPELREEARRWFLSKSRSVFSFVALCESLDLDAEQIRDSLKARLDPTAGKKKNDPRPLTRRAKTRTVSNPLQ